MFATPGVLITPKSTTSQPESIMPFIIAFDKLTPDFLVSRPKTTTPLSLEYPKKLPTRYAIFSFNFSPYLPRIPSVPKYCLS